MALVLPCAKCGQRLNIPEELKGKQIRCPKCRESYVVEPKSSVRPKPAAPSQSAPSKSASTVAASTAANPRPTQPPQRPAAGSPAAGSPAPKTVRCPKCSLTMRLPESSGTTTFQCAGCSTILKVGSAAATVPAAPVASRPSQSGSTSRAPAPQAAANPYSRGAGPYVSQPVGGPLSSAANSAYRPPAAAPSYRQPGPKKSLLGPGLLIAIPNGIGVLLTSFLMISILIKGSENSIASTDQTVLTVLFGFSLLNFVLLIGGAIGMTVSGPRWLSITTCILALLPTLLLGTFCLGVLLYPFSLGGAIWGLVVLFGNQSAPAYAGGGAYASASPGGQPNDYMQRARNDAARQNTSSSDGETGSTLTAVACLGGGVVCLAITVFLCFALYTSFTGGDVEVRRPGKAIGGTLFFGFTGFSLLAKGAAHFMYR